MKNFINLFFFLKKMPKITRRVDRKGHYTFDNDKNTVLKSGEISVNGVKKSFRLCSNGEIYDNNNDNVLFKDDDNDGNIVDFEVINGVENNPSAVVVKYSYNTEKNVISIPKRTNVWTSIEKNGCITFKPSKRGILAYSFGTKVDFYMEFFNLRNGIFVNVHIMEDKKHHCVYINFKVNEEYKLQKGNYELYDKHLEYDTPLTTKPLEVCFERHSCSFDVSKLYIENNPGDGLFLMTYDRMKYAISLNNNDEAKIEVTNV